MGRTAVLSPRESSPMISVGGRLVAFMAGLTVAILALELVVRWVTPQPLQHLQLDDEIYVVNRPGARFTYARGSEYAIPITYNTWGFRGPVPTRDVPLCTTRIVLIGDSQTEGLQVHLDETYGQVLQRELKRRWPNRRFEVVNLAVSGYGTHQELLTLKRYGPAIRPDWVVLGFHPLNDPSDNVRLPLIAEDGSGVRLMSHHFSPAHRFLLGAKLWIGSVSHLYAFCKPRVKQLLTTPWLTKVRVIEPPPAAGGTASSREATRAFWITDALVRMTRAEAQRLDAQFVVLTVPSGTQVVQPGLADNQDRLDLEFATAFERAGILHVEALEPLRQSHQRHAAPFFSVDGHLNAVGHRVIGEMLGRWLATRLVERLDARCEPS
jgi:GDSL-like lipase/acylhydrolase family protein